MKPDEEDDILNQKADTSRKSDFGLGATGLVQKKQIESVRLTKDPRLDDLEDLSEN